MQKLISTFTCKDAAGNTYTVNEHQDMVEATHMQSKGPEYIGGMKTLTLDNGQHVNPTNETGLFRLLDGTEIRRV